MCSISSLLGGCLARSLGVPAVSLPPRQLREDRWSWSRSVQDRCLKAGLLDSPTGAICQKSEKCPMEAEGVVDTKSIPSLLLRGSNRDDTVVARPRSPTPCCCWAWSTVTIITSAAVSHRMYVDFDDPQCHPWSVFDEEPSFLFQDQVSTLYCLARPASMGCSRRQRHQHEFL